MQRFAVILPAAGRSSRFGDPDEKKIYADLAGRAVWLRSLDAFVNREDVGQILVAIAEDDRELFERRYRDSVAFLGLDVVIGGAERADTVAAALARMKDSCDFVAVHDAARPCVAPAQVAAVFQAARDRGAAMLAVPVADTIKRATAEGDVAETVPRDGLFLAQTPQVFRRDWLVEAYERRDRSGRAATDDAQLVEAIGRPIALVPGSSSNLKITTREDLNLARAVLAAREEERPAPGGGPFADERAKWDDLPRIKPSDLFDA